MRICIGLSCALLLACGAEQNGTFEALTYNVAGLPQGISSSDPERNMPLISPHLNAYDVVLVQEDFSYHAELSRSATHRHRSTPKMDFETFVNDGLNRFSKVPFGELTRVQWDACFGDANSGSGDCLAEKGFSVATTELAEGVEVDVYNFHAEAGGGAEDIAARDVGYRQLEIFAASHSAGRAVIMGADTNLHQDDPVDEAVLQRLMSALGLSDACRNLACGDDRIDRFLIRSTEQLDLEATAWRTASEMVDDAGGDLSDHLGVHVTFRWTAR